MKIKKFICKHHGIITTRKGLRNHIREHDARNKFTDSSAWKTEDWEDKK